MVLFLYVSIESSSSYSNIETQGTNFGFLCPLFCICQKGSFNLKVSFSLFFWDVLGVSLNVLLWDFYELSL